jgi:gas vesicle protein
VSTAVVGLLGAAIGAVAGIVAAFITQNLQAKTERKKWLRTKREQAYSNTLRFLLKTLNRRSGLASDGMAYLGREAIKEWLDDVVEAQIWANYLTIYCSESQKANIAEVASNLNETVSKFLTAADTEIPIGRSDTSSEATLDSPDVVSRPSDGLAELPAVVSSSHRTVLSCAREDIGLDYQG